MRRYKFRDRATAEQAEFAAQCSANRNYVVALSYRERIAPQSFRQGDFAVELFTIHPGSGRPFSAGPVAVVADRSSNCPPEIVDALAWSDSIVGRNCTPSDQAGFDLRDVAESVRAACVRSR